MKKTIFVLFLVFLFCHAYSQKTEKWKINDSTFAKIQVDAQTYKTKKGRLSDSIQFFFLANFFNDTVKIILGKDTLVDTVLSTRKEIFENGIKQVEINWFLYLPKMKISSKNVSRIYYLIGDEKIKFPFKKGYSMIYFRNSPQRGENGSSQVVYSLEYTNEYLGRL
jgi:hypothetical protein